MASGFKIKIVHAENIKADIDESEISLKVSIEVNDILKKTSNRSKRLPAWNEMFIYKTSDIENHDFVFTLLSNDEPIGTCKKPHSEIEKIKSQKHETKQQILQLKANGHNAGWINVVFTYYEREDFIGGIQLPRLSLAATNSQMLSKLSNAIDNYKTENLNCYSCLDDDNTQGFQFYPRKFKPANERANQTRIQPQGHRENAKNEQ